MIVIGVVGDSGKASESSLLNDLQAVNVADLDLRTLMLIASNLHKLLVQQ